jgi:hypothetical protein
MDVNGDTRMQRRKMLKADRMKALGGGERVGIDSE